MSDRITIDIPSAELDKAVKSLAFWTEKKRSDVKRAISKGVIRLESTAKINAPVDTTRLRSSINSFVDPDGLGGGAGTNVHYAPHQEFGTVHQSGTPFLRPAAREESPKVIAEITSALNQL